MTIATCSVQNVNLPLADDDHEQIDIRQDGETGLRLIVAVHSTVLGPALGGMRLKRYPGGLPEALDDVMCLARTMTLKASAAGLERRRRRPVPRDGRDGLPGDAPRPRGSHRIRGARRAPCRRSWARQGRLR